VSVEMVMKQMEQNAEHFTTLLLHAIPMIAAKDWTNVVIDYEDTVRLSTMLAD
jgi:hypothetical protein